MYKIINAGESVEKKKPSCTICRSLNLYSHYGRRHGDSLKKLGIRASYDPPIPLPGIYPKETEITKDTCTPLFIAALVTIPRT